MLADILPLMSESVEHWLPPARSITGQPAYAGGTEHRARIIYSPGQIVGAASHENMPNAAATIWLANHPRPIAIGDTFGLPDGETLKVVRIERRTLRDGTLAKVYLS